MGSDIIILDMLIDNIGVLPSWAQTIVLLLAAAIMCSAHIAPHLPQGVKNRLGRLVLAVINGLAGNYRKSKNAKK